MHAGAATTVAGSADLLIPKQGIAKAHELQLECSTARALAGLAARGRQMGCSVHSAVLSCPVWDSVLYTTVHVYRSGCLQGTEILSTRSDCLRWMAKTDP